MREDFLSSCVGHAIFYRPAGQIQPTKKIELIDPKMIGKFIPSICRTIGIPIQDKDETVLMLTTEKGRLDESALLALGEITREALVIATVLMAIRYRRFGTLVTPKMVTWTRDQIKTIKARGHQGCAHHGTFVDWCKLVNKYLLNLTPTDQDQTVHS